MNYGDTLYTIIVHEIENPENDRWIERSYNGGSLRRFPLAPTESNLFATAGAAMRAFNAWDVEHNDGDWKFRGVYAVRVVEDAGYGYIVSVDKVELDTEYD